MKSKHMFLILIFFIGTLLIFITVNLEPSNISTKRPDPSNYICDNTQLKLVKQETEICSNTGYLSDYCFAVAKSTICTKISKVLNPSK